MGILWIWCQNCKFSSTDFDIFTFGKAFSSLVEYTIVRKFALSMIVRILKIYCKKLQFCTISHFPIFSCFDAWKTYTWEILGVLAEKTDVRENCLPVFNENLGS
jgi:hypothetical protein